MSGIALMMLANKFVMQFSVLLMILVIPLRESSRSRSDKLSR